MIPTVITSTAQRIVRVDGDHKNPTWCEIQVVTFRSDGLATAKTIRLDIEEVRAVAKFVGVVT